MSSQPETDRDYGVPFIEACWALTAVAAITLIFRYTVKAWARWVILPGVSSPERVWGLEDLFYLIGFGFDISHMVFIQKSLNWGLGRHMWFLSDEERTQTLKNDFISQPLAVLASMFSRCGMTWFLYSCFSSTDKHIRFSIIVGMVIQIVANMTTVVQIVVQCGPNPYRNSNRIEYFHYIWDPHPADGSVVCQSPTVQTTIGFVQGGFNTTVDFFLTVLSAVQLWQHTIRATDRGPIGKGSFLTRFKRMNKHARTRRIWQTLILSGPLALSGIASIVKTYLLKSIGETQDITHKIIPFVLFVKIENYSILLATCGPIIRLFVRVVFTRNKSTWTYWSNSHSNQYPYPHQRGLDLDANSHSHNQGSVVMSVFAEPNKTENENNSVWEGNNPAQGRERKRSSAPFKREGYPGVTVQTDITVRVDEDRGSAARLVR